MARAHSGGLTRDPNGNPSFLLRSQSGQNGQILFISGEQLSLNVAGDSAKTLSVLENMGGAVDDCGLRFVQRWRRSPQNTPDFGGPTDFSKNCLLNHHLELAPPGLPDHPGGPGGFFMIYQYPNHPAVALTGLLELRLGV